MYDHNRRCGFLSGHLYKIIERIDLKLLLFIKSLFYDRVE
ncbi:hypothetical protein LEP1GSC040_3800 [Leptospira santarosai str. 2000030832]|uniref:Uncharacterized protein n=1 Tax=Leptospira santarosai serovar Arenal str. MAVJ 401 TaxID=1049976 RepID=M6JJ83_9LEPT|nr:hypothetical protein LEP1GSC040_3800 [Leptospira santarosai str. 2000030832]EMN21766.1 hypothetical protein LEP1GSC063_3659 [Leptospira santarosai serovar Arenal str. MAVJ 401]